MDEYDAPLGWIWVCQCCGRRNHNRVLVGDESCFLNAQLVVDPEEVQE